MLLLPATYKEREGEGGERGGRVRGEWGLQGVARGW